MGRLIANYYFHYYFAGRYLLQLRRRAFRHERLRLHPGTKGGLACWETFELESCHVSPSDPGGGHEEGHGHPHQVQHLRQQDGAAHGHGLQ